MKRVAAFLLPLLLLLTGCGREKKYEGLLHRIPDPPKAYALIEDGPAQLTLCVPDVTLEEFESYQGACIRAGYTKNADDQSIFYYAEDQDGYRLEISVSKSILYITLKAPEK